MRVEEILIKYPEIGLEPYLVFNRAGEQIPCVIMLKSTLLNAKFIVDARMMDCKIDLYEDKTHLSYKIDELIDKYFVSMIDDTITYKPLTNSEK